MIQAGHSGKYGQVWVERSGSTGFDASLREPIALHRAQDEHAVAVMEFYLRRLMADPTVPMKQVSSVQHQLTLMREWRAAHPERVHTPGTPLGNTSVQDDAPEIPSELATHIGPFGPDAIEAVAAAILAAHGIPNHEKSHKQAVVALTAAAAAGVMFDQTSAWQSRAQAAEAECAELRRRLEESQTK